jgi:hypothetical protein
MYTTHRSNLYAQYSEAFAIFAKYADNKTDALFANHEALSAGPEDPNTVSEEDRKRLKELGWVPGEVCGFVKSL